MATPGTTHKLIRNLAHMLPPPKGSKFADVKYPTQHRHRAKWVPTKDRFPFWNITVGDRVVLRRGDQVLADNKQAGANPDGKESNKVMPTGIVVSLDREKNWLWLRDIDENNRLAPKQLRHIQPRLIDPQDPGKGYGPNVMEVPKPVHYSQCRLVVPGREDSPAIRLTRSEPFFNKAIKAFQWKRFAVVKNKDGSREKIHVPWPKTPEVKRTMSDSTSSNSLVSLSTFLPWDPSDPINLSSRKSRVSPQSTLRALTSLTQSLQDKRLSSKSNENGDGSGNATTSKYAFHEGMKVKTVKPPPIAQGPNPDEKVWMRREEIKSWSSDSEIKKNFKENGGKSFVGEDYLELSPTEGPWSSISNSSTSNTKGQQQIGDENSDENGKERDSEGKLIKPLDPSELDSLPIELLMKKDLTNMKGLKWRMKHYKLKQERVKKDEERKEIQNQLALKVLREKVLQKE